VLEAQILQGDGLPEDPDEGGHHDGPDGQDDQEKAEQARDNEGRDPETAERDGQHPRALPPHKGVTLAAQQAVAQGHGEDGDDHEDDGQGRRLAHARGCPHVDVLDDLRGEHVDAAGHADHGGHAEGGGRGGKDQKASCEETGGHERKRDVPEDPQRGSPADAGGLLEGVVHLLQGARHVQEGQRVVEQGHDPYEARDGVDVEGAGHLGPEELNEHLVHVPHAGRQQEDPGDGAHVGRDHVGDEEQRPELPPVRQVAAHDEPGQARGEDHGEQHREAADPEGHHHGVPVALHAVDGDVVLEADLAVSPQEAPQDEQGKREQDEGDEKQEGGADDEVSCAEDPAE